MDQKMQDKVQRGKEKPCQAFPSQRSMLLFFLRGSKALFGAAVFFAALTTLLDLISPRIVSYTVDCVLGSKTACLPGWLAAAPVVRSHLDPEKITLYFRSHLLAVAALAASIAALAAVCRYFFRYLNARGAEKLVQNMRNSLFSHIEKLPFTWYQENDTGDIIQRCTSDVETVKRFLSQQFTALIRILIMMVLSLSFMAGIEARLTVICAAFIPVIVIYSMFFLGRISRTFQKADSEEGVLSSMAQENLTGVRVVRAFGRERYERRKFEKQNDIYTKAYLKLTFLLSVFWSAGDFISGIQVLTAVALGACMAVRGHISAGEYIAFISYNQMLVWPVRQLGRVISEMGKAGVSVERIRYIMNSQEEKDLPDAVTPPIDRDIVFDHVTFAYGKEQEPVLKDVSFIIKKGTTVGILGGTGTGKSTLMYLLKRMYVLDEGCGHIRIGGVDVRNIKAEYLRKNIGMVLQEPFLFSKTLGENIAIAREDATQQEIREAARMASLEEAVQHFSRGYETPVGERGVTLSGGQKQRAAIAQMVIQHTPVMIFDDSLSAVDAETDTRIRARLEKMAGDTTIILISHRISTLRHADHLIVLNKGSVAEEGTHEELVKKGGIYSRICQIQTAGEEEADA